ncbi:benzoate/H(+) symporter BenE family transporter [Neisseriaceae bacterium CLB008]|nr:benzoate/H(+) symporter BenE family transporter [Neisseriaceae bacterium]
MGQRLPISVAHITSALVALLVGYGSSAVVVYQAATVFNPSNAELASWFWALAIACGVGSIALSLKYKAPILLAWSTPGAALIFASVSGVSMSAAIGAFMFAAGLMVLFGVTGLFDWVTKNIPSSLAAAMLSGVLLKFGTDIFLAMQEQAIMVCLMLVVFLLSKIRLPRYSIILMMATGLIYVSVMGLFKPSNIDWGLSLPVLMMPSFDLQAMISVGLPLFIVTMATQNIPGIAILRSHGYDAPASPLITKVGLLSLVLAPFGSFMVNLAAITAAICMGPDVDKDPSKRYMAAVWAGAGYIVLAFLGGSVVSLFATMPPILIMALAGLALLGTIGANLSTAMADHQNLDAVVLTVLMTASGVSFFDIGSAFWGLLLGLTVFHGNRYLRRRRRED